MSKGGCGPVLRHDTAEVTNMTGMAPEGVQGICGQSGVTGEGGPGKAQCSCWSDGKSLAGLQQKVPRTLVAGWILDGTWLGTDSLQI